MPDIEGGEGGNPVTMYFLENDVRGMQRLTKGSQVHFRKQIRMALYKSAEEQRTVSADEDLTDYVPVVARRQA